MNMFSKSTKLKLIVGIMAFTFTNCEDESPTVIAGFTYAIGDSNGTVTFLNTSTNATEYLWEFGDGETSTEVNPKKTFLTGSYIVSLKASNSSGTSNIFKSTLDVINNNIATNGDFENDITGWIFFQNGGTAAIDNTTNNGGTSSGKLTTGGPSNPALKQERISAGTVKAGDVVRITFDHKGVVVPPGSIFNVLLFGEKVSPGASFTHVFNPAPKLGADWSTFTGSFTIPGGTDVSQGISFLIEAVCGGDAECSVTANIDNVSVTLNP